MNDCTSNCLIPEFIGTTVLGERGQVVVPKELRSNLGLKPGTKLVVLQHQKGFIMVPSDSMKGYLSQIIKNVESITKEV